MADCAAHVALAAVTGLAWLGLGSLVLAVLGSTRDRWLDTVNRIGVGALAFAFFTFSIGWAGLAYAEPIVVLVAIFAAVGLVVAAKAVRGVSPASVLRWPRWELALAALIVLYVVLDAIATCAPISSADALFYHAAAPELYEQEHRIQELPWSWNSYQPFTVEMLVLDGFLLWDSVQGAFAPLLLAIGAAATVAGATYRLAGRTPALLAAAVFFAQPFTTWVATSTFVEPGLAFMVALGAWNLVDYVRRERIGSLALAGTFAGGAAGMKYLGTVVAVLLAAGAVAFLRRRLRLAHVLAFGAPAIALALPWYVKNAVLTGNPIYPFVFGGANPEATRAASASLESYGHGTSALDFVLLPVRLLADAEPFDRGEFVSPLFLLFAPLALLDRRARFPAAVVLAIAGVFVVIWFLGSQQARFLVPLMPALAALAAVGMVAFARAGRIGLISTIAVAATALASGAGLTLVYTAQFVPVASGRESGRQFLYDNTSYYAATDWMNRNLPADARVALGHVFALPLDRPAVVTTADALETTAGREQTLAFVDRFDVTHAAVFENDGPRRRQLGLVGARQIATVTVRPVLSRTLSELGPPEQMLIYALAPP